MISDAVLAEYCHPLEKSDSPRRSVVESRPANPLRKAGHEFFTAVLRAYDHRFSLPVSQRRLRQWAKPDNHALVLNATMDLTRSKPELVLENMLLRQQLIVLKRQVKRAALTRRDRTLLVLLASKLRTWKQALVIVQPETVLRWHRELFRWVWRRKSRQRRRGKPPLTDELVALIKQMAKENRTWGAERIRGELLKLGLRVSKSTIQKYIYIVRKPGLPKQTWATFLRNHAKETWACDFLQTYDLLFRSLFVFVVIELGS